MSITDDDPKTTIQALDNAFRKDKRKWFMILFILNIVGLADTNHLKIAVSMTPNMLKSRLELLLVSNYNGHSLISEIPQSIKRPTEAHRPARIYRLEKGGAMLLLSMGVENARACALFEDIPILHALCMLTFHLLALREKDIKILTDQNLYFGEERHFRPDHQIIQANGECAIFEIEQKVTPKLQRRMVESLANRQAFFQSKEGQAYSKVIRMIINVKEGKPFDSTVNVWAETWRQLEIKSGQELGFTIYAIPIQKFLNAPEWGSELSRNWTPISSTNEVVNSLPSTERPRRSMGQDAALLHAFGLRLRKELANTNSLEMDMGFVSIIEKIYAGSFGNGDQGPPKVSIGILKRYLKLRPDLKQELYDSMHYYRSGKVWTQVNVLHQMGVVIRVFLNYHNWADGEHLRAYPTIDSELRNSYVVKVEFNAFPNTIAYFKRKQNMEAALTWVLTALFEYGKKIGLKRPEFW